MEISDHYDYIAKLAKVESGNELFENVTQAMMLTGDDDNWQ